MWVDAHRDGHPAKYKWHPLLNAVKFGWCPVLECRVAAAWHSGNIVGRINEVTLGPVSTEMDDRLQRINHLSISPSHPGQLSLLPSAGREMSTSQSAVMLCDWGVKAGIAHSTCG